MKENHITDILDGAPLASLSERELLAIRTHVGTCAGCDRAFETAQITARLMQERAAEAAEKSLNVNPFFHTRVLAAWREQQSVNSVSAFRRMWNATGALVAAMAATTAALAVLTIVVPSNDTSNQQTAALVPYSAEAVILDQDQDDNQMSNDQVLNAIYVDDESK